VSFDLDVLVFECCDLCESDSESQEHVHAMSPHEIEASVAQATVTSDFPQVGKTHDG
jgi:hypothetical protein